MSKPNSVRDCRTARDFTRTVQRQGGEVRQGSRHIKAYKDGRGPVAIPRHRGDLAAGTVASIIRGLLYLGFLACPAACVVLLLLEEIP